MIRACTCSLFETPIHHVHFAELVADPLRTVSKVYRHFGLDLREPRGVRGRHYYRIEEFGLNGAVEQERFARYI
jgi:hypothetical protein